MPDETRKILFEVQIDIKESKKSVEDLTAATVKQEEAIKKTTAAIQAEENSIAALRKSNQDLTKERNSLSTATEKGRNRIEAINKELDKNNATIKANVDSYTKQKLGIGDYTGALDKLVPGLGATTQGIIGMTKASLTFLATPLGLILVAIAAALAPLVIFFKNSEEGADKLAKIFAQLGAIADVLVDRIEMVGKAFASFLSGDVEGGVKGMEDAFSGLGDELEREIRLAGLMADALDQLEDRERVNMIAISETTNEIKKLIIESKNRLLTEQQRIDLLNEATQTEILSTAITKGLLLEQINLEARRIEMANTGKEERMRDNETALEFAKRLATSTTITKDETQKLAEMIVQYNGIQGESLTLQEKLANQMDILAIKQEEKLERDRLEMEAVQAKIDLYIFNMDLEAEREEKRALDSVNNQAAIQGSLEKTAKINIDTTTLMTNAAKKYSDDKIKFSNKVAEIEQANNKATLASTADALGQSANLFRRNTIAYKVLATSQAIINTYLAATMAFATAPNYILGVVFAALAVVNGLASVARINEVQFARGGRVVSGKRITGNDGTAIYRSNGDNLAATVRVGEVVLNEKQQARLGGARTFARIGVPGFAGGGYITANQTQIASDMYQQQNNYDTLGEAMSRQKTVLVYQDFQAKQEEIQGIEITAQAL